MQAAINSNQKAANRRKLHIGLHFEFGLVPVYETQPDLTDTASPLERAYHRQQLQQRVNTERDSAYRQMRLG